MSKVDIDLTKTVPVIDLSIDRWDDSVDYFYKNGYQNMTLLKRRRCKVASCDRQCQLEMCTEHLRDVLGLEVKTSNVPGGGFGLFATKKFAKEETVAKFSGKAITKLGRMRKEYTLTRGGGKYLDCSVVRCAAALANRATNSRNNCAIAVSGFKVSLKTKCIIRAGQEMSVGYGNAFKQ
jgi:hypothetical protein